MRSEASTSVSDLIIAISFDSHTIHSCTASSTSGIVDAAIDFDDSAATIMLPARGNRIMASGSSPPLDVLVVDDNPRFGELAEMFLEDEFEDIAVETATSAGEGERLLNEHDIDCVVSDYQMPERDGIEFLQAVREESPDLPFILMTGNGDETVASRAITAGVTDYIQKEAGSEHYDLLAHRIRNVVDRQQAEAAKKARNRRIRRVYERINDGFVALDAEWRLTYMNSNATELLSREREELLGKELSEVFPGVRETEFYDAATDVVAEQEVIAVEEQVDLIDAWIEARIFPDVDGLSIYFREITDRKERERSLERSRKRYRALVDAAPAAILVTDAESGDIVEANRAAEELLGRSADDLTGENHSAIHPAEDKKLYDSLLRERVDSEPGLVNRHADGSQIYVETAAGDRIPVEITSQVIELEDEQLIQSVIRDVVKRS